MTRRLLQLAVLLLVAVALMAQQPMGGITGPSSGGSCTPPPSTNLKFWYESSLGSNCSGSPCTNGGTQTAWADQSGNADNLSASANATFHTGIFGSQPGTLFSSSLFSFGTSVDMTNGLSVYAVTKLTTTAAKGDYLSGTSGSYTAAQADGGTPSLQGGDETGIASILLGNAAADTSVHITAQHFTMGNAAFFVDGSADGTASTAHATLTNETVVGDNGDGVDHEPYAGYVGLLIGYSPDNTPGGAADIAVNAYISCRGY